jgi:hypothetical protein
VCGVSEKGDESQVAAVSGAGELNPLIKYFGLDNAGGNIGDVVLIVAIYRGFTPMFPCQVISRTLKH